MSVDRFLLDLSGRYARHYTKAVRDMLVAMARGNDADLRDARKRLEDVITETMGAGEVLGATMTMRAVATAAKFRADDILLPRVGFVEALEDLVDRAPRTLRNAAQRTAQRISQLYGEGRVIAFARSAEASVTERVKALIVEAVRDGTEEIGAGRLIKMGVDEIRNKTAAWSESYARMAFRTNLNTAVTAGRFRQAQDQDVKAITPAFRFDAIGDSDTRDNHGAADGLIFRVDNAVWNRIAPPLGHNCRCEVNLMTTPMLKRLGRLRQDGSVIEDRLPAAAHPDAGFRHPGRPDLFMTGVAG